MNGCRVAIIRKALKEGFLDRWIGESADLIELGFLISDGKIKLLVDELHALLR